MVVKDLKAHKVVQEIQVVKVFKEQHQQDQVVLEDLQALQVLLEDFKALEVVKVVRDLKVDKVINPQDVQVLKVHKVIKEQVQGHKVVKVVMV